VQLIGLTGGIGSGKSTVAKRLQELGAVVVDADKLARDVVEPGTEGLADIHAEFGDAVIRADGSLDRAALGAIVFSDPTARHRLNEITHPAVKRLSLSLFEAAAAANPDAVVIYDVPLLTEARARDEFDQIVVTSAPEDVRIERLVNLRGMAQDEAERRVASQATEQERLSIADHVIDTSGSLEQTVSQTDALWAKLSPSVGGQI